MTPTTFPRPSIRRASSADAEVLAALARSTFIDTFAADNDPRDMEAYVTTAFGESVQHGELLDARNTVLLAERDGAVVGYAMLRDGDVPACVAATRPIEVARLYAVSSSVGTGVGSTLMAACLADAARRARDVAWLGVWERNARAIGFYRHWGFEDVGSQCFQLGDDRQVDRVMRRVVAPEG